MKLKTWHLLALFWGGWLVGLLSAWAVFMITNRIGQQ